MSDHKKEERAIMRRSALVEVQEAELVEVECGKCGQMVRARKADVEETIERRRAMGIAAYYKCRECYR